MTLAMGADMIAALAQLGTMAVIVASVAAGLVQLRHLQAGNQLQALLSLQHDFLAPELQAALTYVQERLPERLEDPAYRRELERIGYVNPANHPEMVACNWFNMMGTLVKRKLVSEAAFMDLFARLMLHYWNRLSPAIAIMRRTRGAGQYHDFEYLATRAKAFLDANPEGELPQRFTRERLPDPWRDADFSTDYTR